jgi:transcriptional regulator with XRE-family HTH domain
MRQEMASLPRPLTVGGELRRTRERRGISLTTASDRTRISIRYLEALENDGSIHAYPGAPYARFFLREYASYLGLDPEPLVEEFVLTIGGAGPSPIRAIPAEYMGPERRVRPLAVVGNGHRSLGDPASRLRAVLPESLTNGQGFRTTKGRSSLRFHHPLPSLQQALRRVNSQLTVIVAAALVIALVMFGLVKVVTGGGSAADQLRSRSSGGQLAAQARQLPRGGRVLFPKFRMVAFYGTPETSRLGILGIGADQAAKRLIKQATGYREGHKPVLPAFEIIATVALGHAGDDGMYRRRVAPQEIQSYLNVARRNKIYTILDIQPGRSDFMTEVKVYEQFLTQPDVGLALDAEWHVGPTGIPGQVLGSVDAKTINKVVDYLVDIVKRYNLPQKLLVIHRFTDDMIKNKERIKTPPQLAVTLDVDGFGEKAAKYVKYQSFVSEEDGVFHGIKLYLQQDTDLMSPQDVLYLAPQPDLIVYQ